MKKIIKTYPFLPPFFLWGAFLTTPFFLEGWVLEQCAQYSLYGIFAMSLALIWGKAGILSFGHAIFFGIAAYAVGFLTSLGFPINPLWIILSALIIPALIAFIIGCFLFSGSILGGAHIAVMTLAISIIAEQLIIQSDLLGGMNGIANIPPLQIGNHTINTPKQFFWISAFTACALYTLLQLILSSRHGLVLKAICQNEQRTRMLGYNTSCYKILFFMLSASIAGIAGGLFATQFDFISADLAGSTLSIQAVIWAAIAGKQHIGRVFSATLLLLSLESLLQDHIGPLWLFILGVIFILKILAYPVFKGFFIPPKWPILQEAVTKHKETKSKTVPKT